METGKKINQYEIRELIGKGGMGEVFLARDTKLDRKVALKILPAEFADDGDRMSRFVREAKSASALNHPNIITIYEIGESDGAHYIATEFIDGRTLTAYAKSERLSYRSALDIALQVASALDEAHRAGIVHRDIKPDNIMIRENGMVKILDFGIAKLTSDPGSRTPDLIQEGETLVQPDSPESRTPNRKSTLPGMIIGTANYMSPEQAKGKEVDARTDIFSFGVVLYEMIAGHLPFEGETPLEMIGAILKDEPKPLTGPDIPSEFRRIINKTLRKDRDERYQTIKGLMADLKDLNKELEFQDKLEKTIDPQSDGPHTQILRATTLGESNQTTNVTGKIGKSRWVVGAGAVVLVVIAILAGSYFFGAKLFSRALPFSKISSEELFTGDSIENPTPSPDGKMVAYYKQVLKDGKDTRMIVVRQLGSGAENVVREVDAGNFNLWVTSFSPDGEYIYFRESALGEKPSLYKIPTLGGSPQKIMADAGPLRISPDGKKIAFKKSDGSKNIYLANIDGSDQQMLLAADDINAVAISLGDWSPDSTKLAILYPRVDIRDEAGRNDSPYFVAVLDTSDLKIPAKDRVKDIYQGEWGNDPGIVHWTADGNGLIFTANKLGSPLKADIFYISYPGGALRQLTDDAVNYLDLEVASDGKSVIAKTDIQLTSLWSLDPTTKSAKRLTSEDKTVFPNFLSASNDGRLYFLKRGKGADDFYSMNQDGTDQKKLFSRTGTVDGFHVTPDGKYIVANAWPPSGPGTNLYRMNLDGSGEIQLTNVNDTFNVGGRTTASGYVWFFRQTGFGNSKPLEIMRVPVGDGPEEKVERLEPAFRNVWPIPSPDEKYLAYFAVLRNEDAATLKALVRVVELKDGVAGKKIFEMDAARISRVRWTPDGKAIVFERDSGHHDLFKIDIGSKKETQLSEFETNMDTWDYVWSQDGTKVLLFKSSGLSSLVRIKDATNDGK